MNNTIILYSLLGVESQSIAIKVSLITYSFISSLLSLIIIWITFIYFFSRNSKLKLLVIIQQSQLITCSIPLIGILIFNNLNMLNIILYSLTIILFFNQLFNEVINKNKIADIPPDPLNLNLTVSKEYNITKVQIGFETRNSLNIKLPAEVTISDINDNQYIIGLASDINKNTWIKLVGYIDKNEKEEFSLVINPSKNYWERTWNTIIFKPSYHHKGKVMILTITSLDNLNASVYLSISNQRKNEKNPERVFLISLDTLRGDYEKLTNGIIPNPFPTLSSLKTDGVYFTEAFAQSCWTLPSHATMFLSQYPSVHGIFRNRRFNDETPTFVQELRKNDFLTYGYVTHSRLKADYGFSNGFDFFTYEERDQNDQFHRKGTTEKVIEKTIAFLDRLNDDTNLFVFLHIFDIHNPYLPIDLYRDIFFSTHMGKVSGNNLSRFSKPINNMEVMSKDIPSENDLSQIKNLYLGDLKILDLYLGLFISYLKDKKWYDDSLIIITSDHGEEFREHNSIFHNTLYDEVIKVPFILKLPKNRYDNDNIKDINKQVSIPISAGLDLAPTILDILNIDIPTSFQGQSLIKYNKYNDYEILDDKYIYSERILDEYADPDHYSLAIRNKKYKYIINCIFNTENINNFNRKNSTEEFYDLINDPIEIYNNINNDKYTPNITAFRKKADEFINNSIKYSETGYNSMEVELNDVILDRLRKLGYIE